MFEFYRLSKRNTASDFKGKATPAIKVLCTGISLFILLVVIRTGIIPVAWNLGVALLTFIPKAFLAGYQDFLFVFAITLLFGILIFLMRKERVSQNRLYRIYLISALISLVAGILNKQTIGVIGHPFSYQWLYYSDFMGSTDARNALLANLSWNLLVQLCLYVVSLFLLTRMFLSIYPYSSAMSWLSHKKELILIGGVFLVSYALVFNWYKNYKRWQYNDLANPVTFFFESALKSNNSNLLFSMEGAGDFEDLPAYSESVTPAGFADSSKSEIKNVVVFVLESVPAEYLDNYGGKFAVTPEINKLTPNSMRFEHSYAHSPSTNNSMVSILSSVYPWISYKSLTKEHPQIKVTSVNTLLRKQGYRTAFYSAGDLRYQRGNEFLSGRQFDRIEDFSSKRCKEKQFIVKGKRWDNPDGSDDQCMVESFTEWVDADIKRPFFATLWTVQTHYPYFFSGEEKDYGVNNPDFNRYLNALRHSDQAFGKLMNELRRRGLEESTLVVIVGDHGEAFGRHEQFTHASKIYEENVHVPLILVNRKLYHGETSDLVSGHIDVAPTIMDILKFPADRQWQGHSLLGNRKNNRTYFFAPWSDFLFGFRENQFKYIYNATKNTTEVYDLEKDPYETINLASEHSPADLARGHKRLAQWIQYEDKFMKTIIAK